MYISILVSICDMFKYVFMYFGNVDSKGLIQCLQSSWSSVGVNIYVKVRVEFMFKDINSFLKRYYQVIVDWCEQVLVLGFNCRYYDFNLIKEYFIELIVDIIGKV